MDFIKYFSLLILSFFGLISGSVLAFFTKEELDTGKKYFQIMQSGLFVIILILFVFSLNKSFLFSLMVFFIIFFGVLLIHSNFKFKKTSNLIYIIFSFIFYLSSKFQNLNLIASLIFIYGMPTGSLLTKEILDKKKGPMSLINKLKYYLSYLIIALILYFLQ